MREGSPTQRLGTDFSEPTVYDAIREGLSRNGLTGDNALGIDLTDYAVGSVAHVTSLAKEVPSYELAELRVGGEVRAVVRVDDTENGYLFAALSPAGSDYPFASTATLSRYMTANGLSGTGTLVWAWADEGASPFTPYVESTNPSSSSPTYLTPQGVFATLHLAPGLTPSQ